MNPDSEPWNIALVDNDALVRSYLETYLGGLPEFNICWSMQSGRDAVEAYHHSIACTNCVCTACRGSNYAPQSDSRTTIRPFSDAVPT